MDLQAQKVKLLKTLRSQHIDDQRVLSAIEQLPRERFVSHDYHDQAYDNKALPIQCQQTISQPYIIALMTQTLLAGDTPRHKVLEIGTGSGYQTAILSMLVNEVFTIERIKQLYSLAKKAFAQLELKNIDMRLADGYQGWPEQAPFDGIMVTAAPQSIPEALKRQLNPRGGRMIIPTGDKIAQQLLVIDRHDDEYQTQVIEQVQFVPLVPGTE